MKRVLPDPKNVYIDANRHIVYPQYSITDLPKDIISLVLGYLRFGDVRAVSQTCKHLYRSLPRNEGLWERLFRLHFPNLPRFEPHLSWRTECELQRRCTRNLMAGVHSFQIIPIGQVKHVNSTKITSLKQASDAVARTRSFTNRDHTFGLTDKTKPSCFALDEQGNIVIGYENGAIAILNPKTGKDKLLCAGKTSAMLKDSIQSLICKGGLYIARSLHEVKVWDAKTKKFISSFGSDDPFAYIKHMKFVDGRLLVSNACEFRAVSPTTTIQIWDPKSTNAPITVMLAPCPGDITLCGKTFVATFASGAIQVLDLESKVFHTQFFAAAPFKIYAITEKTFLLCDKNSSKIYIYFLDDPEKTHEICLWSDQGIPNGFKGDYGIDHSRCPFEDLSLLFNMLIPEQFDYWDWRNQNEIRNIIPQQVCKDAPCVFNRGKVLYFSSNKEAILCLDFTASHETILRQLVQMLEKDDNGVSYVKKILKRMPKSVQDEIDKIYFGGAPPSQTQRAEPVAIPEDDKLVEMTKSLSRDQLMKVITALKAHMSATVKADLEANRSKYTEGELVSLGVIGKYDDKDRLKQAIVKYLETLKTNVQSR